MAIQCPVEGFRICLASGSFVMQQFTYFLPCSHLSDHQIVAQVAQVAPHLLKNLVASFAGVAAPLYFQTSKIDERGASVREILGAEKAIFYSLLRFAVETHERLLINKRDFSIIIALQSECRFW
eukprot:TRINITY_DN7543_c0_g1_i1.p2 TRINITY_DN7543_c0_g1~~TRINITY_DN7543_c0_g1_i1.p2  ORF type:complete len:124 (-),score=12.38 TRINITY_DN7543_c0_g1_i1:61-432(-)